MDNTVAHRPLEQGEMLNWYRVERILGRGGFGIIYLATDTNLDHLVAIKEYRVHAESGRTTTCAITEDLADQADPGLQRFIDEARNLVRFKHPNIVRVMSVFELNETAYMVMEFEEGHDLLKHLSIPGNRDESALKALLVPIIEGLAQVHKSAFIHRDIKPANIMVRTDGSPVLLDFGSARNATPLTADSLTALVSAGYSPLEQYSGSSEDQQGPWTDIYALGAVLYFAVTGVEPVDSAQRGSAIVNGGQDPLIKASMLARDRYSPAFLQAIDWALEFRIVNRPQSLAEWQPMLLATVLDELDSLTAPGLDIDSSRRDQPTRLISSRQQSAYEPLNGLSMRDQPVPREVEAVRKRRFGNRSGRWLVWSTLGVLILSGGGWLLQDQLESKAIESTSENATEPVLSEQDRLNIEAAEAQADRERQQLLMAQRQAREQAEARAAAVEAAEQATARKQAQAQKLAQEESAREAAADAARQAAIEAADAAAAQQAAQEAAEQARAAEVALEKAEQERAAQQAAKAKEAARARSQQLNRELDRATSQLQQGLLDEASSSLDKAAALSQNDTRVKDLRTRLQAAFQNARAPVTDADLDYVIERFDRLRRALESNDAQTMDALTVDSDQNALFRQLMSSFATLDIRIDRIRVRNAEKSVSARLRIETMTRDNGDRATPSSAYRERTISSRRQEGQWSAIQW